MTQPAHPFTLLADPVRRRIVEVLAVGEHSAGTLCEVIMTEFAISRTAVSHHLRVLRDHDAVTSTIDAVEPRARSYRLNRSFLAVLDEEVERLLRLSDHRYDGRAPCAAPGRSAAFARCAAAPLRRGRGPETGRVARRVGTVGHLHQQHVTPSPTAGPERARGGERPLVRLSSHERSENRRPVGLGAVPAARRGPPGLGGSQHPSIYWAAQWTTLLLRILPAIDPRP
jgi:DNA-binding transcriptional ArsR family regulator